MNPTTGWANRILRAFGRAPQLQMLWPESMLATPPSFEVPPGFELRNYDPRDQQPLRRLMNRAGFRGWGAADLEAWLPRALEGGYTVLVDVHNGTLAATSMAAHHPSASHPFGGELCWLAVDPDYRGRGLGHAGGAATTQRLLQAGYRRIYLTTDDHRLPAIRIYLELGYVPFLFDDTMEERWRQVYRALGSTRSFPIDTPRPDARRRGRPAP